MSRALIALGANVGNRKECITQALSRLSFSNTIVALSDIYETYGRYEKRNPYLNCCVEIETDLTSRHLMQFLIETQKQLSSEEGESRENYSALDLDLIAFDEEVVRTPDLTLPHPEAHKRAFVMIPLAQIKPQWIHPVLNLTAEKLAEISHWQGWGTFFTSGKRYS
jgi:2-amino-4-hydroxy-6-hydroxymethyldihydropteridine diphosphokinase